MYLSIYLSIYLGGDLLLGVQQVPGPRVHDRPAHLPGTGFKSTVLLMEPVFTPWETGFYQHYCF